MKRWYLLYCKRGDLARARLHLENQGVECYYPEMQVEKLVRGKRKVVTEPLFSSYLFVRFDYEAGPTFTTVRSSRGVVDFVRQGSYPQEVQGDLIYELKQVEQQAVEPMVTSLPDKGQVVRIKQGQFAGLDAIYSEADGELRSILLIKLISQTVEVRVSNSDIELQG